jgi:hypothetical protein
VTLQIGDLPAQLRDVLLVLIDHLLPESAFSLRFD